MILLMGKSLHKKLDPRPHQINAISNTFEHFRENGLSKGKIIHPCGSGKSLTAYWCAKKLNVKNILIAVPSLALVRQTKCLVNTVVSRSDQN